MKRLILGALLLLSTFSIGQNNLKLFYTKDIMTDKEYVMPSENLLCSENGKQGFLIKPVFDISKSGTIKYTGLIVQSAGIGGCMENDDIIFLFEDGTKVSSKSWNDFNCKGMSYFDFYQKLLPDLNKKIKAIRLTNGRSYDSYTYELKTDAEKNYFIYMNQLLTNQKYEIKNN